MCWHRGDSCRNRQASYLGQPVVQIKLQCGKVVKAQSEVS